MTRESRARLLAAIAEKIDEAICEVNDESPIDLPNFGPDSDGLLAELVAIEAMAEGQRSVEEDGAV